MLRSEITSKTIMPPAEPEFPKMYINTEGEIVLFANEYTGICVGERSCIRGNGKMDSIPLGFFDDEFPSCYSPDYWLPFIGTLTLTQD